MSLAQLLYPPPTDQGLEEWMHSHARHHEALNQAIEEKIGQRLQMWPIYPVIGNDLTVWNRSHQALHNQMNQALGIQGGDLSELDIKNKDRKSWFFQHSVMHQSAAELCGQPV